MSYGMISMPWFKIDEQWFMTYGIELVCFELMVYDLWLLVDGLCLWPMIYGMTIVCFELMV